MSGNQPTRRPKKNAQESGKGKGGGRSPKKNAPATGKGKGGGRGGQKRSKQRGKKKSNESAIDPKRPLWENPDGEAKVREIVGSVRPAHHPTAVIRSLGDPPLGKYASNAHHYFDAVYEKAQHFAVAIATANGLLVEDRTEDDGTGESAGDGGGSPSTSAEPLT